jgi:hypothetical protein
MDDAVLRNWKLEGSINDLDWVVISEHINDKNLKTKKSASFTWKLNCDDFFNQFRISLIGPDSNDTNILSLGGIEFYGILCFNP